MNMKDQGMLIKELQDHCKKVASPYKYPREIEFIQASEMPKTVSGKIRRNVLRDMERSKKKQLLETSRAKM